MRVTSEPWPAGDWRRLLAEAVGDADELLALLGLDGRVRSATPAGGRRFPLRVPRGFVARMRRGDPADPLLRQVLPLAEEDVPAPGFSADPLGELAAPPVAGVLHKYEGRALVVATGACAVHCRYCFRRHFPYAEHHAPGGGWQATLDRIAADPGIAELILSGGDPLTLSDARLAELARAADRLPQLRRFRVHTRLPIVLPQRVDETLVEWLRAMELPTVVVVHANHANEIDDDVRRALAALRATGASLLNQSVLLAGVNDSAAALAGLSETLLDAGVLPYYLHMLDPVAGSAHFAVAESRAAGLVRELAARLPGYLVPRLVREVAGAPSKLAVDLEV
ncbi:MAG: EF-P beta-lysylation protein EpmB [Thermoanaerobaculales bacterium]|nr:EF-P beta-lysylation protein EpmB [Thermoanaerobaculales bacterium]